MGLCYDKYVETKGHMTKKTKAHQVKAKWYYCFWGACTLAVVAGQLYVGTGYRLMADEVSDLNWNLERVINPGVMEI